MTKSRVDDALSSLAPLLRVRPELQDICRFGDDWESWHDAAQPGWAVVHGECLIDRPGHATMRLKAGDILLLPHGGAHLTRGRIGVGHASCWARRVTQADFAISTTISGVNMRLTAVGIRELHWHQAAEWAYMTYGHCRITVIDPMGRPYVADV
jgi:hypothetical protein